MTPINMLSVADKQHLCRGSKLIGCLKDLHHGDHLDDVMHCKSYWCHCTQQVEFPIALIDRNLDRKPPEARAAAEAFVQYCFTPAAQREFASCGFRRALLSGLHATSGHVSLSQHWPRIPQCLHEAPQAGKQNVSEYALCNSDRSIRTSEATLSCRLFGKRGRWNRSSAGGMQRRPSERQGFAYSPFAEIREKQHRESTRPITSMRGLCAGSSPTKQSSIKSSAQWARSDRQNEPPA